MSTKLTATGVEFPDATTQTTSGLLLTGGTMTGTLHVKTSDSGATAVAGADDLIIEHADYGGMSILSENEGHIYFGDNEDADVGRIEYNHSTNSMIFRTNASDALTIKSDGRGLSQFTAKAWANFNGTGAISIRDSHNISSIADVGTGQYTITFTNAMANDNHATVASLSKDSGTATNTTGNYASVAELSATTYSYMEAFNHSHARQDVAHIGVITFGD